MSDSAQTTIDQITPENAQEALKGKTNEEISEMLETGKLDALVSDPEAKIKLLSGDYTSSGDSSEADGDETPSSTPAENEPGKDETTPQGEQDKPADSPDTDTPSQEDWGGFSSKEELLKSHSHGIETIRKQKEQLDKFNAERGTLGKQVKDMEQKLNEATARINAPSETKTQKPDADAPPATDDNQDLMPPSEPTDGDYLSDDYLKKNREWQKNMVTHVRQLNKSLEDERGENKKLVDSISKVEERFTTHDRELIQNRVKENHKALYTELDKFQQDHTDLKTSRTIPEIDQIITTHGLDEAKKLLPEQDVKAHAALSEMVRIYGAFDKENLFQKGSFENLDEVYLVMQKRNGSLDSKQKKEVVDARREAGEAITNQINQRGEKANTLPNDGLGTDEMLARMSTDQKIKRLNELAKMGAMLRRSPNLLQEYKDILKDLGMPVPDIKPL